MHTIEHSNSTSEQHGKSIVMIKIVVSQWIYSILCAYFYLSCYYCKTAYFLRCSTTHCTTSPQVSCTCCVSNVCFVSHHNTPLQTLEHLLLLSSMYCYYIHAKLSTTLLLHLCASFTQVCAWYASSYCYKCVCAQSWLFFFFVGEAECCVCDQC